MVAMMAALGLTLQANVDIVVFVLVGLTVPYIILFFILIVKIWRVQDAFFIKKEFGCKYTTLANLLCVYCCCCIGLFTISVMGVWILAEIIVWAVIEFTTPEEVS